MPRSSRDDMAALRAEVFERAGHRCQWPTCPGVAAELAHLAHRGMGGSAEVNVLENCAALCKFHHDILDGRTTHGRRYEVRVLLRAYMEGRT